MAEDEANKAKAAKEKRLADIAYWRDPEVAKMTGRIITSKKEIRMLQLDIPRISQLHPAPLRKRSTMKMRIKLTKLRRSRLISEAEA